MPCVFASCNKDDNNQTEKPTFPALKKVTEIVANEHTLTVYSSDGYLYKGYNSISVELKDKNGKVLTPQSVAFNPLMTMVKMNFKHSCPHQTNFIQNGNLFEGYSLFQMQTGDAGYWELNFTYNIAGKEYKIENQRVEIKEKKGLYTNFKSFMNETTKQRYFIALANHSPKIGLNKDVKIMLKSVKIGDITNGVKQMEFFTPEGYTLEIDPRMAGVEMGNHSSPNNSQPVFGNDGLYTATINYTMGGNWTLNFIIKNEKGEIVGGSAVDATDVVSKSNIAIEVDVPNDK